MCGVHGVCGVYGVECMHVVCGILSVCMCDVVLWCLVCVCICVLYAGTYIYTFVHKHMETRGPPPVFSILSHGFSLAGTHPVDQAGPQTLGILLSLLPQGWNNTRVWVLTHTRVLMLAR